LLREKPGIKIRYRRERERNEGRGKRVKGRGRKGERGVEKDEERVEGGGRP